jgi:hypothetical protein
VSYSDHFKLVDDVTDHLDAAAGAVEPMIRSKYAGFYAVASAAVLELALKEIIITFAQNTNPLFGEYIADRYEQINGRIKLANIKGEHLKPFGEKYLKRFERLVDRVNSLCMRQQKPPIITSYGNLLLCRHKFAHEGVIPSYITYEEVKQGFESGKMIMQCLAKVLR